MKHPHPDDLALYALGEFTTDIHNHVTTCPECQTVVAEFSVVTAPLAGPLLDPPERLWQDIAAQLPDQESESPTTSKIPRWIWGLAACLGLGVAAYATITLTGTPEEQLIAQTRLEPLPGWDATGDASVIETEGQRALTIDLSDQPQRGYAEVWLISADLTNMISLGILSEDRQEFPVPEEIDLAEYSVVDVSDEDVDGDPTHSGISIVRGSLTG